MSIFFIAIIVIKNKNHKNDRYIQVFSKKQTEDKYLNS